MAERVYFGRRKMFRVKEYVSLQYRNTEGDAAAPEGVAAIVTVVPYVYTIIFWPCIGSSGQSRAAVPSGDSRQGGGGLGPSKFYIRLLYTPL